MKRLDEQTFKQAKKWLRIQSAKRVANRFDLHESTVLNIRGCKNFDEYKEIVKAEHPPVQFSLRDEVLDLHQILFNNDDYVAPSTAYRAIFEIKQKLG